MSSYDSSQTPNVFTQGSAHHRPSRRAVAAGMAWSVPACALAAPALALAVSACEPSVSVTPSASYFWDDAVTEINVSCRQRLKMSMSFDVQGIPADATVTSATFTWWFQQRAFGSAGPGLIPFNDNRSDASRIVGKEYTPTEGSGFNGAVKETQQGVSKVFSNESLTAFAVEQTWSSGDASAMTYRQSSAHCRNASIPNSGEAIVGWSIGQEKFAKDLKERARQTQALYKVIYQVTYRTKEGVEKTLSGETGPLSVSKDASY